MNDDSTRVALDWPDDETEARFAMIETRVEQPLTDEQAADVKKRIAHSIGLGEHLRAFPLGNGDEPEIAFVPWRGVHR